MYNKRPKWSCIAAMSDEEGGRTVFLQTDHGLLNCLGMFRSGDERDTLRRTAPDGLGSAELAAIERPPPAMAAFAVGFCNGLGANRAFQSGPWIAIIMRNADLVAM